MYLNQYMLYVQRKGLTTLPKDHPEVGGAWGTGSMHSRVKETGKLLAIDDVLGVYQAT
jgi:hypothetical protein